MNLKKLEKVRNDADFHLFCLKATKIANKLGVEEPQPPCWCKKLGRFETGNAPPDFPNTMEDHCRKIHFALKLG